MLKAALHFLFHKGLLINVTYLGTQAAECMASYLSIWEWLPDPSPVLWSHSWLVEKQVARKKKNNVFTVASIILNFHS